MKSEKLDLNTINPDTINSGNLGNIMTAMMNQPPKGSIMLDKTLLPSRGKLYPDTPLYVKKLNPLNVKNLAVINSDNINKVINNVIATSIWGGPNFDYNTIYTGDKLFLIFYLRSYTYNDMPFRLRGECTECGNICNYDFTLSNLDIQYLDDDVPEYIELGNGDRIKIAFSTIATENAVNQLKNRQDVSIEINPELLELATYVKSVNDNDLSLFKAYEYITELDAMSFSEFANTISKYLFCVKPEAKFKCPKCGEDIYLPMPFVSSFFLPTITR
jgi:hypothetical protein